MDITDWIIRAAIFGVLAAVVIGTFQNIYTAIKKREVKEDRERRGILVYVKKPECPALRAALPSGGPP